MSESVKVCAFEGTPCEVGGLIPTQQESVQSLGVPEPGCSQGTEGVTAEHQDLQTSQLAEGVV